MSTPLPGRFNTGKRPGTLFTGGWVGPRAGLGGYREEKINLTSPEFEPRIAEPIASHYIDHSIPKTAI
jgi:hypothetical protein